MNGINLQLSFIDFILLLLSIRLNADHRLLLQVEDLEGSWRDKKADLDEDLKAAREQADGLKQETAGIRGWGTQPLQDSHAAHSALQVHLEDVTRYSTITKCLWIQKVK